MIRVSFFLSFKIKRTIKEKEKPYKIVWIKFPIYKLKHEFLKSRKLIRNTSPEIIFYVIKELYGTKQKAKCPRTRRVPLLVRFLATANELG